MAKIKDYFLKLSLGLGLLVFGLISPAITFAATLSLSPSTGTFNRSCAVALNINLDTAGVQTDGTDAILKYNPAVLSAQQITNGTIYSDYPGNNIETDASSNQTGKLTVSGLASVSQAFSGSGTLATASFRILDTAPTGSTAITFDFDPNDKAKTTDSNVVQRVSSGGGSPPDVLNSVVNGSYTIGTGTCSGQGATGTGTGTGATGVASGSAQTTTTTTSLPKGGTEQFTFMFVILGSTLTILGILGMIIL